ncbi:hypothetical protein GCM10028790_34770 [Micromonospora taraxaci]
MGRHLAASAAPPSQLEPIDVAVLARAFGRLPLGSDLEKSFHATEEGLGHQHGVEEASGCHGTVAEHDEVTRGGASAMIRSTPTEWMPSE